MLKDKDSSAIISVSDIPRARSFYGETLGLELINGAEEVLTFRTGATKLVVYHSPEAGTNRANAAVWSCPDGLDEIVADLEAKGVAFEHYPQMPGVVLRGNVHHMGPMRLVWLKDPEGNILHLNNL
jgi:extradiol dioxygenase family protein